MKTQQKMLFAFLLNLSLSLLEFFAASVSGSFAIMSDALHDAGDTLSIGVSLLLERKSLNPPDDIYTYGYGRFSLVGALFTTAVLILGSVTVLINATQRIINPVEIEYKKMLLFAVIGVLVNTLSVFITHGGKNENQKAVNLHMLEDVLGWICILIGAVIMHFTNLYIIDPIMSVCVSAFILIHSFKNLKETLCVLIQKVPHGISTAETLEQLSGIEGIEDIHHLHIWSHITGENMATMHIVTDGNPSDIKKKVRAQLQNHGINHATLEFENTKEECRDKICVTSCERCREHHHHHH